MLKVIHVTLVWSAAASWQTPDKVHSSTDLSRLLARDMGTAVPLITDPRSQRSLLYGVSMANRLQFVRTLFRLFPPFMVNIQPLMPYPAPRSP